MDAVGVNSSLKSRQLHMTRTIVVFPASTAAAFMISSPFRHEPARDGR